MGGTGIGRDLVDIAGLLIFVTLVSMLVANSGKTSQLIGAGTQGFGTLLEIASFQGASGMGLGTGFGSYGLGN